MTNWEILRPYLPSAWVTALTALPREIGENIQEVRLRARQPVTVSSPRGEGYLTADGVSLLRRSDGFFCSRQQLEQTFLAFCDHSLYAHQWELEQGFLAVEGGLRVGVAGTAVMHGATAYGVGNVTALCIRIPRHVAGCARPLLPWVLEDNRFISTLIVGPPSCGKTTLLRDLASLLAAHRRRVTVVDERGELAVGEALQGCDVLRGYPKAVALRQAVRCLAPECVLLDELGDGAEVQAVADSAHCGVAVMASLHGYHPEEMAQQPLVQELIRRRVFTRWLFLQGRETPGQVRGCAMPEVTPDGVDWRFISDGGRGRDWPDGFPSPAASGDVFGDLRTVVTGVVAGDELYDATSA